MYQFNFNNAANIFAGLIQTESPYYQPTPPPPAPFTAAVGVFQGDPTYKCDANNEFSGCDESWSLMIRGSQNIIIASAGLYSWFSTYAQTCIDQQLCQKALILLEKNQGNVRIQHLVTIGAKYMAVMDGKGILAKDNLNVNTHPFWSQISVLDVGSNNSLYDDVIWIDPKIWDMDQPKFTCSPPCKVKIPPWTKATSTVDYPLLTVSDGSWTSTITKPPMTISQWGFEVVTLSAPQSGVQKRQGFEAFWPKPYTTTRWPSVVYAGPDGSSTTQAPLVPFPTPPASIGPDAPPPATGSWPRRQIEPFFGQWDEPVVKPCTWWDLSCQDPWIFGDNGTLSDGGDDDDFDENYAEAVTTCPSPTSSTSTTSAPATSAQQSPPPKESPREGDPRTNKVKCYGSGQKTEHTRIDNTIRDFCNTLGGRGTVLRSPFFSEHTFTLPNSGGGTGVKIVTSLTISNDCQWTWNLDECTRYMEVEADSCNCQGVDGKQGGVLNNDCYSWRMDPNTDW
jgi:hypothetical protein